MKVNFVFAFIQTILLGLEIGWLIRNQSPLNIICTLIVFALWANSVRLVMVR